MAKRTAPTQIFPVIMAGGSGTRFWPLSRVARPKQFLPLATKKPLIEETLARLLPLAPVARASVVCGQAHAGLVKKALPKLPAKNVLVEPSARNTAPAIALACVHVAKQNPAGILVVVPSDQHVADVKAFGAAVRAAVEVAKTGAIVTLGITPTRPETGYGYIKQGAPLSGGAYAVDAFVEKPNRETAQHYLDSENYLWNAGIFVFRADAMLEAFARLMPELSKAFVAIGRAVGTTQYAKVLAREWKKVPSTSIDYGVAEKATNIAVVPCDCGWSDVGSFNALPEVRPVDAHGNVVVGEGAIVLDTTGSVVLAQGRPLAVVGMRDVVVVDAGDAVLVLPKERSQDVRQVVEALKARKQLKSL
jgi:mannose-1-phosphate guanylyltransferase